MSTLKERGAGGYWGATLSAERTSAELLETMMPEIAERIRFEAEAALEFQLDDEARGFSWLPPEERPQLRLL